MGGVKNYFSGDDCNLQEIGIYRWIGFSFVCFRFVSIVLQELKVYKYLFDYILCVLFVLQFIIQYSENQ